MVVARSSNGSSRRTTPLWMVIGAMIAAAPRTSPRLLIFEPMTLPNARPVAPWSALMILTPSYWGPNQQFDYLWHVMGYILS